MSNSDFQQSSLLLSPDEKENTTESSDTYSLAHLLSSTKAKVPISMSERMYKSPTEFYDKIISKCRYILAPMVDQSELAWRKLARRHGAHLCYTPMYHAKLFSENESYRQELFSTSACDRPLIVQFCANDPSFLLKAAKLVEPVCDAVDINFGCPQDIARRGHYGSYLQDDWELIFKLVRVLRDHLRIPVTCKIRIFPDVEKTIRYAKMIESAGAHLLTVHGRVREQKGHHTGLADWEQIRRVKESVSIPVFANGNILYFEDVQKCLQATCADGVMSAEGHLYNPAIFSSSNAFPLIWDMVSEYLALCEEEMTRCSSIDYYDNGPHTKRSKALIHRNGLNESMIRSHLFKLYKPCLSLHTHLRDRLAKVHSLEEFKDIADAWKLCLMHDQNEWRQQNGVQSSMNMDDELSLFASLHENKKGSKHVPHWRCQPYFRPLMKTESEENRQ